MNEHPVDPPRGDEDVSRSRFVTACQQLLVLAVVATVLTPAARTISLDIRPSEPGAGSAAAGALQNVRSKVPVGQVEASVEEIPLTAKRGVRARVAGLGADVMRTAKGERVKTKPVAPKGYAAVGVTWDGATALEEDEIAFQVRTRTGGAWSEWNEVPYHDEHGPDPDTTEASGVRPGSDAIVVGDVDQVQMRIDTVGKAPADLKLSVIDPGSAKKSARQAPQIDTSQAAYSTPNSPAGDLQLAAATPKPKIYSRAQWGANEEIRDRASLSYHEVHTGFVHHTVSANDYSASQVPSIIRGIYHYHVKSLGWSDIGYNFLVDKFGRVWEGRAGGVHLPVVGAHTYGYNDVSFAMSAIGNFETRLPTQKMVDAYGRLFGWKLSLHGVKATHKRALRQNGNTYPAINGHRDAGATACPGRYLYDRLGDIRKLAKSHQNGWGGRQLESHLAAGPRPDLIMRRKSDGRGFVLPLRNLGGRFTTGQFIDTGLDLSDARDVLKVGDWDGDGHGDLIIRRKKDGNLYLHRGDGTGKFGDGMIIETRMGRIGKLAAVGDYDGDGRPDLIGKPWGAGTTVLYPGRGTNGVGNPHRLFRAIHGLKPVGVGLWNWGGAPDVLYRNNSDLYVYIGNGPGGYTKRRKLNVDMSRYWAFVGVHNLGKGGHVDVVAREKGTDELYFLPATFRKGGVFKGDPIPLGRKVSGFDMIT